MDNHHFHVYKNFKTFKNLTVLVWVILYATRTMQCALQHLVPKYCLEIRDELKFMLKTKGALIKSLVEVNPWLVLSLCLLSCKDITSCS